MNSHALLDLVLLVDIIPDVGREPLVALRLVERGDELFDVPLDDGVVLPDLDWVKRGHAFVRRCEAKEAVKDLRKDLESATSGKSGRVDEERGARE